MNKATFIMPSINRMLVRYMRHTCRIFLYTHLITNGILCIMLNIVLTVCLYSSCSIHVLLFVYAPKLKRHPVHYAQHSINRMLVQYMRHTCLINCIRTYLKRHSVHQAQHSINSMLVQYMRHTCLIICIRT